MALPTAQQVTDKWAQRAGAAQADYAAGVQATDKDPTALAIANGQRYINNVTQSYNDGTWARRLRDVGQTGWKQAVQAKQGNYGTGVAAAKDKVMTAFTALLAYEASGLATVQAMPAVSDADREARMLAWIRYMRNYPKP